MILSQAAAITQGQLIGSDNEFSGISIDTRSLQPGQLYCAIVGETLDGHDFIQEAFTKGASAVLVSHPVTTKGSQIVVQNTRQALGALAMAHVKNLPAIKIAVTGSCGKTTTRAFLESIFSRQGNTLASVGSFNNDIGVPLTMLQLQENHQYWVQEVGTNHPGEIAALARLVQPDVAVITNVAPVHLEGFGHVEAIAREKSALYAGLSKEGTVVLNLDTPYAKAWQQQFSHHRIVTFSEKQSADVCALNITLSNEQHPSFILQIQDQQAAITLQLIGEHNVANALAAAACAYAEGLPIDKIAEGLNQTQPEKKRLVRRLGFAGATVIDDSYNANPLSVSAALQVLSQIPAACSIFVFGDMRELGVDSQAFHREIGKKAKALGITKLYCYGKEAEFAAQAFGQHAQHFTSQEALIESLKNTLNADTTVLIKGSHSMRMFTIAEALMEIA